MKIRFFLSAISCAASLAMLPSAHAAMLNVFADKADNTVDNNGPGGTNEVGSNGNRDTYAVRVGEFFDPHSIALVMPFQLPALPAGDTGFTAASFQTKLFGKDGTPAPLELYGLTRMSTSPTVLASDFFGGTGDTANTLIQSSYYTGSETVGSLVTTSTSANNALVNFLNTVDPGGINAGSYVFLRINYSLNPVPNGNLSYSLLTGDAGGGDERPVLTLTTGIVAASVPEPSVYALAGLGAVALAATAYRRRQA